MMIMLKSAQWLNGNEIVKSFSQGDLGVNLSEDFVNSEKCVYRITVSNLWDNQTLYKNLKSF